MAVILVILVAFFVVILIWWYGNLMKWNKYLGKFRGPTPLPIIGCLYKFTHHSEFLSTTSKLEKEFGGIIKLYLGPTPRLLVTDRKLTEFILGSQVHIDKGYEYFYLERWLGTGLLMSTGTKWRRQRKLITPTFHFQILEQFVDIFNKQGNIFVEILRKEIPNKFDIFPYVARCTLDIICETSMGKCVNAQNNAHSDYVESVNGMGKMFMIRTFNPLKMWDFLYELTEDYKLEKKYLKILHRYTNSVIQSRKKELFNSDTEVAKNGFEGRKKLAFLDLLLQARINGEPLPDECIREEVNTFMFEGHDTTASGVSFILYCLSNHPEVQEKAIEELKGIFYDDPLRDPTYEDLQNMKYLELVIKESMRLYPPVPLISRHIKEDVKFEGTVLPKGLLITFLIFGMHRQEDVYSDVYKFDPERFSSKNSQSRQLFNYIPFSAGPRNCIGQRYAMLQMKSIVSNVLRHFEVLPSLEHQPIIVAEATLKSSNGLMLSLKERKFK